MAVRRSPKSNTPSEHLDIQLCTSMFERGVHECKIGQSLHRPVVEVIHTFVLASVFFFVSGLNFLSCCIGIFCSFQSSAGAICRIFSLVSSHVSVVRAWPLELPRVSRRLQPVYPSDALSPPEAGATTYLGGDTASQSEDQYQYGSVNVFGTADSITKMAHARRCKI